MPAPPYFPEPGAAKREDGPYREAGEAAPAVVDEVGPPSIDAGDVEWVGGAARPIARLDADEVKRADIAADPAVAQLLIAKASAESPRWRPALTPWQVLVFAAGAVLLHFALGRSARYVIGAAIFGWFLLEVWKAWRQSGRDLGG